MNDKFITGPFGTYKWGSVGAVMNSMVEEWKIPLWKVSDCTFSNGEVLWNDKVLGYWTWHEDGCSFIYN